MVNEQKKDEVDASKPYMARVVEAVIRYPNPDDENRSAEFNKIAQEAQAAGIILTRDAILDAAKKAKRDRIERATESLPKKNPSPLATKNREIGQALSRPAAP